MYCGGECGDGGRKGQGGVELTVRRSITHAELGMLEFISGRLLKVTLKLCGRATVVAFVVAYAPTYTKQVGKNSFWTALNRVLKDVPENEQLFALMGINTHTGRRGEIGFGSGNAVSSARTVEMYSTTMVSDY